MAQEHAAHNGSWLPAPCEPCRGEARPGQAPAEHGGGPSGLWQRGHRGRCSLTGQAQTLPTPPGPREWKWVSLPCCVPAPGHTLLAVLRLPLPPATEHPAVQCVGVGTLSSHRAGARAQENGQGGAPERLWGSDSESSTAEETELSCAQKREPVTGSQRATSPQHSWERAHPGLQASLRHQGACCQAVLPARAQVVEAGQACAEQPRPSWEGGSSSPRPGTRVPWAACACPAQPGGEQ